MRLKRHVAYTTFGRYSAKIFSKQYSLPSGLVRLDPRTARTLSGQCCLVGVGPDRTLVLLGKLGPVGAVVAGDAVWGRDDPGHVAKLVGVAVGPLGAGGT